MTCFNTKNKEIILHKKSIQSLSHKIDRKNHGKYMKKKIIAKNQFIKICAKTSGRHRQYNKTKQQKTPTAMATAIK